MTRSAPSGAVRRGGAEGGEQGRQLLRLVGAVGVHLHEHVVPGVQAPPEPRDVRGTQTLLPGPVQHVHARVGGGRGVGEVTGPVRARVVHDEHVRVRDRGAQARERARQGQRLVVRGHDDEHAPDRNATLPAAPLTTPRPGRDRGGPGAALADGGDDAGGEEAEGEELDHATRPVPARTAG